MGHERGDRWAVGESPRPPVIWKGAIHERFDRASTDSDERSILQFEPGSPERAALKAELESLRNQAWDIPLVIGGEEVRTGRTADLVRPDALGERLGVYHLAGEEEARAAVSAATAAKAEWEGLPWEERAAVFLRAAELVTGKYRYALDAATMLNQSKTPYQAEIDAVCEVADFFRFNPSFMAAIYSDQPESGAGEWNRLSFRPLTASSTRSRPSTSPR